MSLIRVIMMKLEPSRFSSHCMLIAVLALVAGIAVTVEAAAQHLGIRTLIAERTQNTVVMLLAREETTASPHLLHDREAQVISLGEI